ncbi:MAG: DMT family transporter [Planctomycetota bacterium]
MSPGKSGYLLVLTAAVMWSLGGFLVKVLTQTYCVDPRAVACLRSTVAALVLSWALPRLRNVPRGRVIGAGISYTFVVLAFVVSTSGTTAANAIFLQYAYPLFVAVGAVFLFGESLGRRTILALIIGMSGIALILICSWTPGQREGVAYGFMSAFAFAAFTLFQRSMRDGHPIAMSSFHNLLAAALILPLAWGRFHISVQALIIVAVMGMVQLGIPYVLFIRGLKSVPATDAALITLVEPVLNPIWVWLIIGEAPHGSTILGGAMILVALLTRFVGGRRAEPDEGIEAKEEGDADSR